MFYIIKIKRAARRLNKQQSSGDDVRGNLARNQSCINQTDANSRMGLPKMLETLLAAAAGDNTVKSWTIFEEKSGSIVFKIRFDGAIDAAKRDEVTEKKQPYNHYRRKPPSQVSRDRRRAEAWKSPVDKADNTQPEHPAADGLVGPVTRSRATSEMEQFRADSFIEADHAVASPDLCAISSLDPLTPPFCVTSSPLFDSVSADGSAVYTPPPDEPRLDAHAATLASLCSPLPTVPESPFLAEADDALSSSSSDFEFPECDVYNCAYGGGGGEMGTVYLCNKCDIKVCVDCVGAGVHVRHERFMTLMENT